MKWPLRAQAPPTGDSFVHVSAAQSDAECQDYRLIPDDQVSGWRQGALRQTTLRQTTLRQTTLRQTTLQQGTLRQTALRQTASALR